MPETQEYIDHHHQTQGVLKPTEQVVAHQAFVSECLAVKIDGQPLGVVPISRVYKLYINFSSIASESDHAWIWIVTAIAVVEAVVIVVIIVIVCVRSRKTQH